MMASPGPTSGSAQTPDTGPELWIESTRGSLFFVNALLIFPWIMLAVPLLTRMFVRGVMGGMEGQVRIVDTFPELAEYLMPVYGWLTIVPIWLVVRNLRVESLRGPRLALGLFLALHLAALAWTVAGWAGLHGWILPGAPS